MCLSKVRRNFECERFIVSKKRAIKSLSFKAFSLPYCIPIMIKNNGKIVDYNNKFKTSNKKGRMSVAPKTKSVAHSGVFHCQGF